MLESLAARAEERIGAAEADAAAAHDESSELALLLQAPAQTDSRHSTPNSPVPPMHHPCRFALLFQAPAK